MAVAEPIELLPVQHEDTKAGNYFVSNYPPYSFWKPEYVEDALAALERPAVAGTVLGNYLHIPFCRKRCHFCYFRVYTDKNAAEIKSYIDAALHELSIYASKPFVSGRKPKFVYFGGGTPSYISTSALQELVAGMQSYMPWDEAEEITFECEPGTLTEAKIKAIRDIGVTRLSLGVEHVEEKILRLNGRAHGANEIDRAYGFAQAAGFPQINIDLIAGMMGDTDEDWQKAIDKTLEMAPDSVTIYQMEIPYNTTIFSEMKAAGNAVAPVADWATKRKWVSTAFAALESKGYTVTSSYTAVKDKNNAKFLYRDHLWTGADLLGLGVASFSHVGGTHFQNQHNIEPYMEALSRGELPIYRGLTPTDEQRLIREVILQFKLGHITPSYFKEKFGADVETKFADALQYIDDLGYLIREDDALKLTREGLLRSDRLVHEFFLPEHQDARYA
jgi:oxygen-independent coproporphyrinogen-3 oxidase